MSPIPPKLRAQIDADPYFRTCARKNSECSGRITIDHAWIYGGRQIQELWAFVPVCVYHHLGAGFSRLENEWLSLARATDEDLAKYPNRNWRQIRAYYQSLKSKEL